jgi:hypothetical protein
MDQACLGHRLTRHMQSRAAWNCHQERIHSHEGTPERGLPLDMPGHKTWLPLSNATHQRMMWKRVLDELRRYCAICLTRAPICGNPSVYADMACATVAGDCKGGNDTMEMDTNDKHPSCRIDDKEDML